MVNNDRSARVVSTSSLSASRPFLTNVSPFLSFLFFSNFFFRFDSKRRRGEERKVDEPRSAIKTHARTPSLTGGREGGAERSRCEFFLLWKDKDSLPEAGRVIS